MTVVCKTLRLFVFAMLVLALPTAAHAVYVNVSGNTLTFKESDGTAIASTTLTGIFNGQEITATTDERGRICLKREAQGDEDGNQYADEEDRKKPYCIILPGDGQGQLHGIDFALEEGLVNVNWWNTQAPLNKVFVFAIPAAIIGASLSADGGSGSSGGAATTGGTDDDGAGGSDDGSEPADTADGSAAAGPVTVSSIGGSYVHFSSASELCIFIALANALSGTAVVNVTGPATGTVNIPVAGGTGSATFDIFVFGSYGLVVRSFINSQGQSLPVNGATTGTINVTGAPGSCS